MKETIYNYPERLPREIERFRSMDFNDPNFKASGIFKELIQGHYFLLENMGQSLDSVYSQMKVSTDYLIHNLKANRKLLNTVSGQLFNYLEKRSLYQVSAHLSDRLLASGCDCPLDDELRKKLHKYGDLKVGKTAPDIQLNATTKLSDIKKKAIVLVFANSTCPDCKKEVLELLQYYDKWKEKNVALLYISMGEDDKTFKSAYQNAPWPTYSNYEGMKSKAAKEYHLFKTPTYFLLDKNRKILITPKSLGHINAWIEQKL